MHKQIIFAVFLVFCVLQKGVAQPYFDWNDRVNDVYTSILDLRLQDAQVDITQLQLQEPDNALAPLLEGYVGFLEVFISEEKAIFDRFKSKKSTLLKQLKRGDISSPFYLYSQAQLHLQSALVKLKFQEYFGAFTEVSNAYELLSYNEKKFPNFLPNRVSLGLMRSIVGSIPDSYRWGVKLLGLDGDLEQGVGELTSVLDSLDSGSFVLKEEAQVMASMALLHLSKDADRSWSIIESMEWDESKSLLAAFVKANVARRTGRNQMAINILEQRPKERAYSRFDYLEYMLGDAKLQQLDPEADQHLRYFVEQFKGVNYLKDACKKLGWHDYIFNDGKRYDTWKTKCQAIGGTQVDADKSAQKWSKETPLENLELLQVRLLYDGGYYEEAKGILDIMKKSHLSTDQLLELHYRQGRIAQAQRRFADAIEEYKVVIGRQEYSKDYVIGNAALQLGVIYEQLGQPDEAYLYYKLCKSIDVDQYATSLNQKARAGMERVRG